MNDRFASSWQGRVRNAPRFVSAVRLQRIAGNRGTQRILGIGDGAPQAEEPPPEVSRESWPADRRSYSIDPREKPPSADSRTASC